MIKRIHFILLHQLKTDFQYQQNIISHIA